MLLCGRLKTCKNNFWPRATLKGPKRSFVLLLLLAGVESSLKNVPNQTKQILREQKMCKQTNYVQGNKKCAGGTKNVRVQGNEKCSKGTKNVPISQNEDHQDHLGAKCYLLWHIMVLNWRVCLCMAHGSPKRPKYKKIAQARHHIFWKGYTLGHLKMVK